MASGHDTKQQTQERMETRDTNRRRKTSVACGRSMETKRGTGDKWTTCSQKCPSSEARQGDKWEISEKRSATSSSQEHPNHTQARRQSRHHPARECSKRVRTAGNLFEQQVGTRFHIFHNDLICAPFQFPGVLSWFSLRSSSPAVR